ncbi:virion structural protein [Erwinia phage PhiEaH1]|uniref:Virion structural protein n=1 Tax=Erwinia phage PhiEaH1 TaxID=1401669 RepID=W8D0K1_9CAUD|nr:virion structural protein [Erwinia phage PhiEaH1]AGX01953.1 virion structural protein [Erwinia phage PhiEaH1]
MSDFDLTTLMEQAVRNPAGLQTVAIDYVQWRLDGLTVPDPLSPMVQIMEVGSTQTAIAINQALALDRRRYGLLATTWEDLYAVMTDRDFLNRFSKPAGMPLSIWVERDTVLSLMASVGNGSKKLTIPRYTEFTVSNQYTFTLLYPIEIRQLQHGAIQIGYNSDKLTPLQTLTDNVIPWWSSRDDEGVNRIRLDVNLLQLKRVYQLFSPMGGSANSFVMTFEDSYFSARVFRKINNAWVEMKTTHSEQIHDPQTATAFLEVDEGALRVTIPPIYLTNGLIPGDIRVDVYTTKGTLEVPLSQLDSAAYSWEFGEDLDDPSQAAFWKGLPDLSMAVFSEGIISGGTPGLTFEEARDLVISRGSSIDTPITPPQVRANLELQGFNVLLGRDDLTDRVYYATRGVPNNPNSEFTTSISSGIVPISISMENLARLPGCYDNGDRVTMTPKTLMRIESGRLQVVKAAEYPNSGTATTETLVAAVNNTEYVYSPFHYVLDASNSNFALRAYYLENPKMTLREFLAENQSTLLSVSTQTFAIERTTYGYRIVINCKPSTGYDAIKQDDVHLHLGYYPRGETELAYLTGTVLGIIDGVWTWEFQLHTNYDVDANDDLVLTNFLQYDTTPRNLTIGLETRFFLVNSVTNYRVLNLEGSDVDAYVPAFLLPSGVDWVGVQLEAMTFQLGTALTDFWRGCRPVAGSQQYQLYTQNVLKYYASDVYEMDPSTKRPKYTIVNGEMVYTKLHSKGDPVLDAVGNQEIEYYAGQVKVDDNGEPIVVSERPTLRLMDLFVMDGAYYFTDQKEALADAQYLPARIADTYVATIEQIAGRGLESTWYYYYPKTTIGQINVLTDSSRSLMMNSRVNGVCTLKLSELGYNNEEYQKSVSRVITDIINAHLKLETVSKMDIMADIKEKTDSDLIGCELYLYSNGVEVETISAGDEAVRFSLNRVLYLRDDGKLGVKEDMTFTPKPHITKSDSLYSTSINKLTQV